MKNTRSLFLVLISLFVLIIVSPACHFKRKSDQQEKLEKDSVFTLETFTSADGWGYEIKVLGKTKIKQPYIPAIQGNLPFDSEMDARRIGMLVVEKMKGGQGFPMISKQELDSLQIKY